MNNEKNYWCFRIDKNNIEFFKQELDQSRLRQGWGWDPKQDLRKLDAGDPVFRIGKRIIGLND